MHVHLHTHIHTHKPFFYAVRKFYFNKKKRETIIGQNRSPALCVARAQPLPFVINNSPLTIAKIAK